MAYIFKQKIRIVDELAYLPRNTKTILIYEPLSDLSALYAHYLSSHNFNIHHCPDMNFLRPAIAAVSPDLLIFSLDAAVSWSQNKSLLLGLLKDFPKLSVISTSFNLNNENLKELMSLGVLSHINRRLSRPQDVVVIVKNILEPI